MIGFIYLFRSTLNEYILYVYNGTARILPVMKDKKASKHEIVK